MGQVISTLFEVLGLHAPSFVADRSQLDWLGSRFDKRLDFYGSDINGGKDFDRKRCNGVLGVHRQASVVYDAASVIALARWYLPQLYAGRSKLPVAR